MEERFMSNNSPARHPSISIIIPLYNEEENLYPLVESIFRVFSADVDFLELLLVNDGSYDRTEKMALDLAAREPRIRLIGHERNRGLGAAIRTGLQAAKGDLILYTDADLPFDFKLIPELLNQSTGNNVVIGYRANRGEGLRRYVLTKGYDLICRLALGLRVRDINFACKLIPRRALRGMRLGSEGSFIDAELLMECRRQGFTITECPLVYYPRTRGLSTLSRPKVIAGILTEMFRYRLRRHRTGFEPIYEFFEETDNKRG
jgi:glycosyltransferase involved in cell wall biosynthesis